jgi:hypothetical protein
MCLNILGGSGVIKFVIRTVLIAMAFAIALPLISGAHFHGDWIGASMTSLVFNGLFLALEWALGAVVLGINISTLGLGVIITNGIKFFATLLAPSVALYGTAKVMPNFIQLGDFYTTLVGGLMLGGVLWATLPSKKAR